MKNEWDPTRENYPERKEVHINGIKYVLDDNTAAITHMLTLLIDAVCELRKGLYDEY